jgi:murein DD-endopeptidase MepM/ murein hydrolase activator NlpD
MFGPPIAGTPMQEVFYGAYRDDGGRDYNCGFKWYPGHQGVDILLRNFRVMDSGVAVLAAAAGTVLSRRDDLPDRNTAIGGAGPGNNVLIEHGLGGPLAYYYHLRRGSVRVAPGAVVARGDTLGLVGSSGNSNWPHLHFEVSDNGQIIDPFIGNCNPPVSQPTWLDQLSWQGDFAVLDGGISRTPVTWAELLERPPDAVVFTPADRQVTFWVSVLNPRTNGTRAVLQDPAGAELAQVTTGPFATYSSNFLVATFNLTGLLNAGGRYSIALWFESPAGAQIEVARRQFTYDPAAAPVPMPSPGRGPPPRHAVWIGPGAGDR